MHFSCIGVFLVLAFCCHESHSQAVNLDVNRPPIPPLPSSWDGTARIKAVVELLILVDKEFGDSFSPANDYQAIKDYYTIVFRDVNQRYQTLPNYDISIRITGLKVFKTFEEQPFIESTRDPNDGNKTDCALMLSNLGKWVKQNLNLFPKFDAVMLATNSSMKVVESMSNLGHICFVGQDDSETASSAMVYTSNTGYADGTDVAHELAHILGARHDYWSESACANSSDPYSNFLMGSGYGDQNRYLFSPCANEDIEKNLKENGNCLLRIDEPGPPVIDPDYKFPLAPDLYELCPLNYPGHKFLPNATENECQTFWCERDVIHPTQPVDNAKCGDAASGARCFRGRCLMPGSLLSNVGSGECVKEYNHFFNTTVPKMAPCVKKDAATALDKYIVADGNLGKTLAMPYDSADGWEHDNKCLWTGPEEGDVLRTKRCDANAASQGWDFINVDGKVGEFLLKNRMTKRCALASSGKIVTISNCDANNDSMRWKLL